MAIKTLFLTIFGPSSSIVKNVFDNRLFSVILLSITRILEELNKIQMSACVLLNLSNKLGNRDKM